MRITFLLAAATMVLGGCVESRAIYVPHEAVGVSERAAGSSILLTSGDQLDYPYEEMGAIFVSARSGKEYEAVAEMLKRKATQIGADAVIKVKYEEKQAFGISPFFVSIPYHVTKAEGIAVRYQEEKTTPTQRRGV